MTLDNSGYYGCFFHPTNTHHEPHYGKYESRAQSLVYLMEDLKKNIEEEFSIKDVLVLNYQNIYISMGRYFNDVVHYKCWHKTPLTHKSKVAAHMIKWIRLNPFFSFSFENFEDWLKLDGGTRQFLLEINTIVLATIVEYIAGAFDVFFTEDEFNKIHVALDYYTTTDAYNERMGMLWFQEILK